MAGTGKPLGKMIIEMDLNSAKLTSSLTAVKRSLKTSESQMKAQMAIFDRADNRLGKLGAQYAGLDRSLQLNKKHTENLTRAYKEEVKAHGETSVKAQNLSRDINNSVAKQAILEKQLKATGRAMDIEKLNINELNGKMQAQGRLSAALAESQTLAGNKIGAARAQYAGLSQKVATLTQLRGLEQQKLELLASSQGKASQAYLNQKARVQELGNEIVSSQNHMRSYAKQIGNIPPQFDRFRNSMDLTSQKLKTLGSQTMAIGKKMSYLSVPVGIGLFAATKSAVTFSSEIQKMSALLDDGTVSGDKLKQQLSGLGDASKKWSVQYGISTSAINDGMEEIIKKGYTYEQTLGAMPSIMDASVASGEDFNVVMNNSTSILEQFGLKVADTQGTLKNTQRVTDSLTFVANKTAAGFADMGLAMEYVGPVAHSAEISLEQTSAAIGLMSNNGIEGEKAGTALRGALTRLLKPSKQNIEGFTKLGISSKAFRDGTLDLPTLLDKIKNNTKGWTGAQRASAIALAFGTEAQTGMNVLVHQGGDALRGLTNETKNATGYTKELAKSMGDTPAKKIERFKQSIHVLGIEFGDKVLPAITPLIEKGTELIQKFSEMDDKTQQTIVKWALIAAAAGPVTMGLGAVTKGVGALIGVGSTLTTGLGNIMLQSKNVKAGLDTVSAGSKIANSGMGLAARGASTFGLALSPLGVGILGVGAVLAGGYAAWKIWGEKAYESAERTKRWGTDVGEQTDQTLQKVQNLKTQGVGDFELLASGVDGSSTKLVGSFEKIGKSLENDVKKRIKETKEALEDLPDYAQEPVAEAVEKEEERLNKLLTAIKKNNKKVSDVKANAKKNDREVTLIEAKKIEDIEEDSLEKYLQMTVSNKNDRKKILDTMTGDVKTASKEQGKTWVKNLAEQRQALAADGVEKRKELKKSLTEIYGENSSAVKEGMKAFDDAQKTALSPFERKIGDIMKKYPELANEILVANGQMINSNDEYASAAIAANKKAIDGFGTSSDAIGEKAAKTKKDLALLADDTSKAGKAWNDLIIDKKTGTVKTNLPDVLQDMTKTDKGWSQLKFIAKNADLSTNAKEALADAMTSSDRWNKMTYEEKKLYVKTPEAGDVEKLFKDLGKWDLLNPAEKDLIINAKNKDELTDALVKTGQWNELPDDMKKSINMELYGLDQVKEGLKNTELWNIASFDNKEALLNAKSTNEFRQALIDMGFWEKVPDELKKSINAKVTGVEQLKEGVKKLEWWNDIPEIDKNVILDANSTADFQDVLERFGLWKKLPDELKKKFTVDDKDFTSKTQADQILIEKFDSTNPDPVRFLANNDDLLAKVRNGEEKIIMFNGKKVNLKTLYGNNKSLIDSIAFGSESILKYNQKDVEWKHLKAEYGDLMRKLAYGQLKVKDWNALSIPAKQALLKTNAGDVSGLLRQAYKDWQNMLNTRNQKVIEIAYKTNGKGPSGVLGMERGTDYHRGGPVLVNDAPGAHYRELVTTPSGRSFIPEGRNVLLPNLPRGSSVLRGDLTSKMLKGIPRFAEGTRKQIATPIFANSAVMQTIRTVLSALRQTPNTQGDRQSNQELIEQLIQSNQQQSVMIELLQKLVSKELKIDERALSNSVSRQQAREYQLRGGG
ncbi:hypothetical protein KKC_01527 [Listeria fleischmannii subsp. coloradonensis]|uniref:phage tail tape measure protein n=2 Tax=Listeria fleischmannii TaxID=1069827 RepID=UPI000254F9DE|nr:phage tail tape measure protein [Listeria fleischmannii]EIA21426.1 hypothetical protein KKC_01527 [Listeria fleischmannii subsp. coloradonensis]